MPKTRIDYPSGFHWNTKGDKWVLFSPAGLPAAYVFLRFGVRGHAWHTWDEDGTGGENSSSPTIEQAMIDAESAVLRWGRHSMKGHEDERI